MSPTHSLTLRRTRLFATCAAAAIATVTVHMPLRAQTLPPLAPQTGGFQGTAVPLNGATGLPTANVAPSGTTTTITVNAPRAIINWTPHDTRTGEGAIDFLPQGRSANFVNASTRGGQDYIVLNRIIAADQSRAVALNGLVRSTLSTSPTLQGLPSPQGGQVWFYAPSGLLIGSTAQINVGSLLLTASNVTDTDFLDGDDVFSFSRDNSNASVRIDAGAQISAISRDSYVAIIAPRIVQAGTVTVNGSAAYVAAEQVDMTISGSLFDIAVQVGSDAASPGGNTIEHSGQTTLTNTIAENGYGSGAQGPRDAIMVAVPKNDAVTMLVNGGIAYAQADTANVVGGRIILSGGNNVFGNAIGGAAPAGPAGRANIVLGSGTFGVADDGVRKAMDLEARTTGTASIGTPASSSFGGDVTLRGDRGASVVATGAGQSVSISGDLFVNASGTEDGGGQRASVAARNGGSVTVGGALDIRADTSGNASFASSRTAELIADNGTVEVTNGAVVQADANLGNRFATGSISVTAGTARIAATGSSTIDIGGPALVSASGVGRNGGSGTGGTASLTSAGGFTASDTTVLATGTGARGLAGGPTEIGYGAATSGGAGRGGAASIALAGNNSLGGANVTASGTGGAGGNSPAAFGNPGAGGLADGGTATFSVISGTNNLGGLIVNSSETGGTGGLAIINGETAPGNSTGGATLGDGRASVAITGGTVAVNGNIQVLANAFGGSGGASGGQARAGTASVDVSGGALTAGFGFQVRALAEGGTGPFNGPATGGSATVRAATSGTINASGLIAVDARADSLAAPGDLQFNLRGGTALVEAVGGAINAGGIEAIAWAENQTTSNAQDVVGGSATVRTAEAGAITVGDRISADASGYGVRGGRGAGGDVLIEADGGTMRVAGSISGRADGEGETSAPVQATLASGGTVILRAANGGSIADTDGTSGNLALILAANGLADGGDGTAGIVVAEAVGGAMRFGGDVLFDAAGSGFGAGFTGTGGQTTLRATGGGSVTIASPQSVTFNMGTSGTNAGGGSATVLADNGTISIDARRLQIFADAGANTGIGQGGDALLRAINNGTITVNSTTVTSLLVNVTGNSGGTAQASGEARAGTITIDAAAGGLISTNQAVSLEAFGIGGSTSTRGSNSSGGDVTISASAGEVRFGGGVDIDVSAFGGDGPQDGGEADGGSALVQTSSGGTISAGNMAIDAGASGGNGGGGTGGTARIVSAGGLALGDVSLSAIGTGGRGINASETGYGSAPATAGGAGQGGTAAIELGGTNSVGSVALSAAGVGGTGGDTEPGLSPAGTGGTGAGGTARYTGNAGTATLVALSIQAAGTGGNGGNLLNDGSVTAAAGGGAGTGGFAELELAEAGASLQTGPLVVRADGVGGSGNDGGAGTGGRVEVSLLSGTSIEVSGGGEGPVLFSATGTGGNATSGSGGAGLAGRAELDIGGGTFRALDNFEIRAEAYGGNSVGGAGGDASARGFNEREEERGAFVTLFNGSLSVGDNDLEISRTFLLSAFAQGGNSRDGLGGRAEAGSARSFFSDGTSRFSGDVNYDARSLAGIGEIPSFSSIGGFAYFEISGGTHSFDSRLTFDATAVNGNNPSAASPGVTLLRSIGGTITIESDLTLIQNPNLWAESGGTIQVGNVEFGTGSLTMTGGTFAGFISDSPGAIRVAGSADISGDTVRFRSGFFEGTASIIGGLLARDITVNATNEIIISGMSLRTPLDDGDATGFINLTAPRITAASPQAIADLETLTTIEERSARLGQNDGDLDPEGYLRAADVTLRASERAWVQNTGGNETADDRAGITVGPNTLVVFTDGGGEPVEVIVNAREEDGYGGFVTGESMLGEIVFTGDDGTDAVLADGSTVNGCDIATGFCDFGPVPITGFVGTPNVIAGSANVSDDHSFISISSPRAIIDWTDAQTDFLPSANFAEFSSFEGDFIVLNRVLATDQTQAIQLNGRIDSFVNGVAGRGKIWFYSPSGILVGAGARIDVGSLLLSASNIADADFMDGDNSFAFSRDDSLGAVAIAQGAQISARDPNAYLALLAPRVRQSGTASVSGGAAYVAAEDATLTINGALFDISTSAGTGVIGTGPEDAALVHNGSTTLTNNDESGYGVLPDQRQAVMVAVPKNQAITMLVSGRVEFPDAEIATQLGSSIVLSGGSNVSGGRPTGAAGGTGVVNIAIGNDAPNESVAQTVFGRDLFVQTSGTIAANAVNTNTIDPDLGIRRPDLIFAGSVIFRSTAGVEAKASDGGSILALNSLSLDASGTRTAGRARLVAEAGSTIVVQGQTELGANLSAGHGDTIVSPGIAEIVAAGTVDLLGDARLSAAVSGGSLAGGTAVSDGLLTAGTARATTTGTGRLTVGSATQSARLVISAGGSGTNLGGAGEGGDVAGGTAAIEQAGSGSVSIFGNALVSTLVFSGSGSQSGDASGGTSKIVSQGGTVTIAGSTSLTAAGLAESAAGNFGISGRSTGGTALIDAIAGTITLNGATSLQASALSQFGGGAAGAAAAGSAILRTGATGTINTREVSLAAAATGGFSDRGPGGAATGGTIRLDVGAGRIDIGYGLAIDGNIRSGGGSVGDGANTTGSSIAISLVSGGELEVDGFSELTTDATGGSSSSGTGGDATGGTINISNAGGSAVFNGSLELRSSGIGGQSASSGGAGTGGQIAIASSNGTIAVTGGLAADAGGIGGFGTDLGGMGTGGTAQLLVTGGQVNVASSVSLRSSGFGGDSDGVNGDGEGGTARLVIGPAGSTAGRLEAGSVFLNADGEGANVLGEESFVALADTPGTGGAGTGGTATAIIDGELATGFLTLTADGEGGRGNNAFGGDATDGSAGEGGTVSAEFRSGTTALTSLRLSASGTGGDGGLAFAGAGTQAGDGGSAIGGTVTLSSTGGALTVSETLVVAAFGEAGSGGFGSDGGDADGDNGGVGGDAIGGTINLALSNGGRLDLPGGTFNAAGLGGSGGSGGSGLGAGRGGNAGGAIGGSITVTAGAGLLRIQGETEEDAPGGGTQTVVTGPTFLARGVGGTGAGGGDGLFGGTAGNGGIGGDAIGGSITIAANGTALGFGPASLDADAIAGSGGAGGSGGGGGIGGAGGGAIGGTVDLAFSGATTLALTDPDFAVNVQSSGGTGGRGGTGTSTAGSSGAGGDAIGGTAILQANAEDLQLSALRIVADGRGGQGGSGFEIGYGDPGFGGTAAAGAAGGDAVGGTITLSSAAGRLRHNGTIELGADAIGGSGGTSPDRAGGRGGNAIGGTVTVRATGTGEIAPGGLLLTAEASGGDGAGGGNAATGGSGGIGGSAIGGRTTLSTTGTGRITLAGDTTALARGFGGFGGVGGNGSTVGNTGGAGGNGGEAIGGRTEIDVAGGTIQLGQLSFDSSGAGGPGATGGTGAGNAGTSPVRAGNGAFGTGIGGAVTITVADGSGGQTGRLTAGNSFLTADGTIGGESADQAGSISITETAAAADGTLVFANLSGSAIGPNRSTGNGFSFTSNGGRTRVIGQLNVATDLDAVIQASGNGRIEVGGDVDLFVGRVLTLTQDANAATALISAGDNLLVTAFGVSGAQAGLSAGGDATIDALSTVLLENLLAGDDVRVFNADTVDIRRADASGSGPDLEEDGSSVTISASSSIAIGTGTAATDVVLTSSEGAVTSNGVLGAGRDVLVLGGSISLVDVSGGRDVRLSGGDVALTGIGTAGRLFLVRGLDLTLASVSSSGSEPDDEGLTGLVVEGEGAVSIASGTSASTVTASGTTVDAGSLTAGTSLAVNSVDSTDIDAAQAGLNATLTSLGTIDAGSVSAGNDVRIDSADGPALLGTVSAGRDLTVDANDILLTAGTAGRDMLLRADNGLTIGSVLAGDDITGISFGGTVTAGRVETTGLGQDVEETGSNAALQGVGNVRLDDSAVAGRLQLGSGDGSVLSAGLLRAAALDVSSAANIALNDAVILGSITLSASGGSVSGRNFESDGAIDIGAANGVSLTRADATTFVRLNGGAGGVTLGSSSAGSFITLDASGGAVTAGSLLSGSDIALRNSGGPVNATSLTANRDVQVQAPGTVTLGTVRAGDDIRLRGGSITAASLISDGAGPDSGPVGSAGDGANIDVGAMLAIAIGNAETPGNVLVTSSERAVRLDSADAGGLVQLTANSADISSAGLIQAGRFSAFAGGNISLTDLTVGSDILLSTTGGAISGADFITGSAIDLTAAGGVTLASANAGSIDIESGGGGISLGAGTAGDFISLFAQAGTIGAGSLNAGSDITVQTLAGRIDLATLAAGRDLQVRATDDIALGVATAGDDILVRGGGTLTATNLAASGLGADTGEIGYGDGSNIDLASDGGVVVTTASTADGLRLVSAGGDIRLDNGSAGGLIDLAASQGSVFSSGLLTAQQLSALSGASIALTDATIVDDIDLSASNGTVSGRFIRSDGSIDINGAGVSITLADADEFIRLTSGTGIGLGTAVAGSSVSLLANGGNIGAAQVTAGTDISIQGLAGNAVVQNANAGRDLEVRASGNVTLTTAAAGDDLLVRAGGTLTATSLTASGLGPDTGEIGYGDGSNIDLAGSGGVMVTSASAADGLRLFSTAGNVRLDGATAGGLIDLSASQGAISSLGLLTAQQLNALSGGNISLTDATIVDDIDLTASNGTVSGRFIRSDGSIDISGASLSLTLVDADESVRLTSGGGIVLGTAVAGSFASLLADSGNVGASQITAGTDISVQALSGNVVLQNGTAGRDVQVRASGNVTLGSATAGDDLLVRAGGLATLTSLTASGLGPDGGDFGIGDGSNIDVAGTGGVMLASGTAARDVLLGASAGTVGATSLTAGRNVVASGGGGVTLAIATAAQDLSAASANSDVRLDTGQAGGGVQLTAGAGSVLSDGLITAQQLSAAAANDILLEDVTTAATLALTASGGRIDGDQFVSSNGAITLSAANGVTLTRADGGAIDIFGGSVGITLGSGLADGAVRLASSAGPVNADALVAGDRVEVDSGGAAVLTTVTTSGDLDVVALGPVSLVSADAGGSISVESTGAGITFGTGRAGDSISLQARAGALGAANLDAGTSVALQSTGGTLTAGPVRAGDDVAMRSNNANLVSGTIMAGANVSLQSNGGDLTSGAITAGDFVALQSNGGDIGAAAIVSGDYIALQANGGDLSASSLDAQAYVALQANDGDLTTTGIVTAGDYAAFQASNGNLSAADVRAGSYIALSTANGDIAAPRLAAGDYVSLLADGGDVTIGVASAAGDLDTRAITGDVVATTITAGGLVDLRSDDGDLQLLDSVSGSNILLRASNGSVDAATLTAGKAITIDTTLGSTAGEVSVSSATAGTTFDIAALATAAGGTLTAGDELSIGASSIALGNAVAGGDIGLVSRGGITALALQAGDDVVADAAVAFAAGNVTSTGAGVDDDSGISLLSAGSNLGGDAGSNVRIRAATVAVPNANAPGTIDLTATAGDITSTGLLQANDLVAQAAQSLLLNDVLVSADLDLSATGGVIAGDSFRSSGGAILLDSRDGIALANAQTGTDLRLASGGAIALGAGTAGQDSDVRTGARPGSASAGALAIELGTVTAGRDLSVNSAGALDLTAANTARSIQLNSIGTLQAATLTAGGDLRVNSAGAIEIAQAEAAGLVDGNAGGALTIERATAGTDLRLSAGESLAATMLQSDGTLSLNSLQTLTVETNLAGSSAAFNAAGDVAIASITAGTALSGNTSGRAAIANAVAGTDAALNAGLDLDIGSAQAGGQLRLSSGQTVSSTGLLQADSLLANAGRDLDLNDVDVVASLALQASGGRITGESFTSDGLIALNARDSITLASADAASTGSFVAGQAIALGTVATGGDLRIRTSASTNGATEAPDAARTISADTVTAGGNLLADAAGNVSFGTLRVGASGSVQSARSITVGTAAAGTDLSLNAVEGVAASQATAGRDLELVTDIGFDTTRIAPRSVTVGTAQAGDDLVLAAFGRVEAGALRTTGRGDDGTDLGQYPNLTGAGVLIISETGTQIASIDSASDVFLNNIAETRGAFRSDGSGGIAVDTIRAGGSIALFNSNSGVTLGTAEAANSFTSRSGALGTVLGEFTADSVIATAGEIEVQAPGDVALTNGRAGGAIRLASSAGSVAATGLEAGGDIALTAAERASAASALAGGGLLADATEIELGTGIATTGDVTLTATGAVVIQQARAGDDIGITAGRTALVGAAAVLGTGTDGEADGFNVSIQSAGDLSIGDIDVVGNLRLVSTEAGILRVAAPDLPPPNALEAGGNIFVSAISDLNLPNVTAGGSIDLSSAGTVDAGTLTAGSGLAVRAGADFAVEGVIADGLVLANATSIGIGTLRTTQGLELVTPGALRLGSVESSSLTGTGSEIAAGSLTIAGNISLTALSGDIAVESGTAGGSLSLTGEDVSLTNGSAGGTMQLTGSGNVIVGTARSGGDFDAIAGGRFEANSVVTTATSGGAGGAATQAFVRTASIGGADAETGTPLLAAATGLSTSGSDIRVAASGSIRLDNGNAAGALNLTSSQAGIGSAQALVAVGDIVLTGPTGVQAVRVDAGGRAILAAQNGNVLASQDIRSGQPLDATGRAVSLTALGALAVRTATASAGGVELAAGGSLTVQTADASGTVIASSGGMLALNGLVNGTQLSLISRDIAVGAQAQIGSAARTGTVQVTANGGSGPIVIGGSGSGGTGYRFDNAELGRFTARDLRITGQNGTGTLQVDTVTLRGAGAGTTYNVRDTLTINGSGDIEFVGKLAIENAGEGNVVRVAAGRGIFADAAGAGVSVTDGAGALTGRVELEGRDVIVASRAARDALELAPDVDERDERLGENDGAVDEGGFVRAGTIRIAATDRIYVQNSGDGDSRNPDDRAGLSAGSGGIVLAARSSAPVEVIINGRQNNGSTAAILGKDLVAAVRTEGLQGSGFLFAEGSTINGCAVGGGPCGVFFTAGADPAVMETENIRELNEEEEEAALTRPPAIGFNRLITLEGSLFPTIIDEPVTGSGNEDLSIEALIPGGMGPDGPREEELVDQPVTGSGNEALQSPDTPVVQMPAEGEGQTRPDANGPVTGTGNDDLQNGTQEPDGPVTGTGNEDLQNRDPGEE